MNEYQNYREDGFLGRWVSGELSDQELSDFENWLLSHPEERSFFEDIRKIWTSANVLPSSLSAEQRWQAIQRRLNIGKNRSNSIPMYRRTVTQIATVAAAILLLATFYWWSLSGIITVQSKNGEIITHSLPDGSEVILNAASTLSYSKRDWAEKRDINFQGEGFFRVAPGSPFTVTNENISSRVLGTSFNFRARQKNVIVSCYTGKVRVSAGGDSSVILTAGLQSNSTLESETPGRAESFNTAHANAWINGDTYFNRTPLNEVFAEITRQFDISISLQKDVSQLTFTGKLARNDLATSLEIVCLSSGLQYERQSENKYTVY